MLEGWQTVRRLRWSHPRHNVYTANDRWLRFARSSFTVSCAGVGQWVLAITTARQLADVLADFQLFLGDNRFMPDYSNCVWVEHWDGNEWEDTSDD